MERKRNIRTPLPAGTKLTKDLVIERLLSECGGSSLTYLARKPGGEAAVIKESFPLMSVYPIYRDGYRIVFKNRDEMLSIAEKFDEECRNSQILSTSGDSNSIYHPRSSNITAEVNENPSFAGTDAQYILIGTVDGFTLSEILEETEFSLRTSLIVINKILTALKSVHSEPKRMLHLDLKCDNLFFPKEIKKWEETFAIILDSGSAQRIGEITEDTELSISEGFSAREIQLYMKFSSEKINDGEAAKRCLDFISEGTDLYSVGAIAFRMLMGRKFDNAEWEKINQQDSPKKRTRLISDAIRERLEKDHPYSVDGVAVLLSKALYYSAFGDEMKKNRYQNCDQFMSDVEEQINVLDKSGKTHEIVLMRSVEMFGRLVEKMGLKNDGDPICDDDLFVRDWFPEVKED